MNPRHEIGVENGNTEVRLIRVATTLLRRRRVLVFVPLGLALLVVGVSIVLPRDYTTTVSFISVAKSLPASSQLAGIAAQFGVAIPGQDAQRSPQFYVDLVKSADILLALAQSKFSVAEESDTLKGDLVAILDEQDEDRAKALYNTVKVLSDDIISVGLNRLTGVVSISVRTESRQLSLAIAQRVLDLINEFDLQSHQSQAAAEKAFIENRLASIGAELRAAEDSLRDFLLRNRQFSSDPELTATHDRLMRVVTLRQDVFRSLTESFENARIESVRNTPSVVIVEQPKPALRPDRRFLVLKAVGAVGAGIILALAIVLIGELKGQPRPDEPDRVEFERELASVRWEIQRTFRGLTRRSTSSNPS